MIFSVKKRLLPLAIVVATNTLCIAQPLPVIPSPAEVCRLANEAAARNGDTEEVRNCGFIADGVKLRKDTVSADLSRLPAQAPIFNAMAPASGNPLVGAAASARVGAPVSLSAIDNLSLSKALPFPRPALEDGGPKGQCHLLPEQMRTGKASAEQSWICPKGVIPPSATAHHGVSERHEAELLRRCDDANLKRIKRSVPLTDCKKHAQLFNGQNLMKNIK
jgi:hypothetical protein